MTATNPEEIILEKERAGELRQIIQTLSGDERMLLQLKYEHEASYKEISDVLGTSEEAARKRTERLLRKLRRLLVSVLLILPAVFLFAMTTNAEFRERVINWYLTTFRQNSVVQTETDDSITMERVREYRPSYVPERFRLAETLETDCWIVFGYRDEEGRMLDVTLQLPGVISSIDTSGLEMKTLMFRGERAYLVTDGTGFGTLLYSLDGMTVIIDGHTSPEEMLRIAEGIGKEQ